jgi:tRNA A37 threonylcarbamoyladenosine dehydratase
VNYSDRFNGIGRLYGNSALDRLRGSHVCVVGVGGVGSWTVEALARSGVGRLTLVDLDDICISNTNRQLHTTADTVGKLKVEVLAARVWAINPDAEVHLVEDFLSPENVDRILDPAMSFVVDAVDDAPAKTSMVLACTERGIPLVLSGGAGGRRDAAAVTVADLTEATNDGLLRRLRKRLRRDHGYAPNVCWNLPTVFSPERQVFPGPEGEICELRSPDGPAQLDCATGFGAATFVTGSFGFAAASVVVDAIAHDRLPRPRRQADPES